MIERQLCGARKMNSTSAIISSAAAGFAVEIMHSLSIQKPNDLFSNYCCMSPFMTRNNSASSS